MRLLQRWYTALRPVRRPVVLAAYGMLAAVSYLFAFLLRFEFAITEEYVRAFALTLPILVAVRVLVATVFRLASGRWRYISTADVVRLVAAVAAGSVILFLLLPRLTDVVVPRSVLLLEAVLTIELTATLWIVYRLGYERLRQFSAQGQQKVRRVLMVGAGEAGSLLAREIQRSPIGYRLAGFLDDDPVKWGCLIHGVPVLGPTSQLGRVVQQRQADEIVVAIPSAEPEQLRELVELCEETRTPFKVLPGIAEVLKGDVALNQVRELQIEDLLGREPVELQLPELAADLQGRCVLITGAAGSIGTELSRQVALHEPDALVLLDQSETQMFFLETELRRAHPSLRLAAVIGDIRNEATLTRIFTRYGPDRVFHAAAYKHVPLLESNPEEAIENNIVGTFRVADAAGRFGAAKFVLVSTDKAVQPSSIMGASKRLAELAVLELQGRYPATSFGAVRFGNVLGSSGSVLPIFRRQLERAEPLTVTHPDVTRYFMTIPEAVQLILQASLLPELRGHIAMLDMGTPVKIVDLARNFLRLSGAARTDESIVFTGLRPGEKLHEELSGPGEEPSPTSVPKVQMLRSQGEPDWDVLRLVRMWENTPDSERDQVADVVRLFTNLTASGLGRRQPTLTVEPRSDRGSAA